MKFIVSTIWILLFAGLLLSACGSKPSPANYNERKARVVRYADEGKCNKVISSGRKLLVINDKDAELHRLIADCYMQQGQTDSAEFYYQGAIVFNPADREAYERIGDIYFDQAEYHEAMTWYDRALQIGFISPGSYIRLARIHYNWHEYTQAMKYYQYALAADSARVQALYGLGSCELALADTSSAIESLQKAAQYGKHAGAAFKLGLIYESRKQYDDSIKWLDRCSDYTDDPEIAERAYQRKMEIIVKMKAGQG